MVAKLPVPNTEITVNDRGQGLLDKLNQLADDNKTAVQAFNNQVDALDLAEEEADRARVEADRVIALEAVTKNLLPNLYSVVDSNRDKYAGAGDINTGNVRSGQSEIIEEFGFWNYDVTPPTNRFFHGRTLNNIKGESETGFPRKHVAGFIFDVYGIGTTDPSLCNLLRIPEAPFLQKVDGTGEYSDVNEAIADASAQAKTFEDVVVTCRQDIGFWEAWVEDISINGGYVFDRGLVQNDMTSEYGISQSYDNIPQGYSAAFVGDTTSRGLSFLLDLTNLTHLKWAQDRKNNMFFVRDKIVQIRLRWRAYQGLQGIFNDIAPTGSSSNLNFSWPDKALVFQGAKTTPPGYGTSSSQNLIRRDSTFPKFTFGTINPSSDLAVDGLCFAFNVMPIQRRNRAAYVKGVNEFGSSEPSNAAKTAYSKWTSYDHIQTVADSYEYSRNTIIGDSGAIADTAGKNGREDGKFYDAVYMADICTKYLTSARKVSPNAKTIEQFELAHIGSKIGWEAMPITQFINETVTVGGAAVYDPNNNGGSINFNTSNSDNPRDTSTRVLDFVAARYIWLIGDNNNAMKIKLISSSLSGSFWPYHTNTAFIYKSGNVADEFNAKFPNGTVLHIGIEYDSNYYQSQPFITDIVFRGVSDFVSKFPNGCGGAFNSNSLLLQGDASAQYIKLNRKLLDSTVNMLHTNDGGATWNVHSSTVNFNDNEGLHSSTNTANIVALWNYRTKSKFTESSNVLVKKGDFTQLIASNNVNSWSGNYYGNTLGTSLFGEVATGVISAPNPVLYRANLIELGSVGSNGTLVGDRTLPSHNAIELQSLETFAYKAVAYPVNVDGRLGLQFIGQEIKGGGDTGKFAIGNGERTITDDLEQDVQSVTHLMITQYPFCGDL